VINWGLIEYFEGYEQAGQTQFAYEAVRWSLDYFIKAHPSPNEFYGQTGDGAADHAFWGKLRHVISHSH
jgi:endoglucanase